MISVILVIKMIYKKAACGLPFCILEPNNSGNRFNFAGVEQ